jgi:hypothetical protein
MIKPQVHGVTKIETWIRELYLLNYWRRSTSPYQKKKKTFSAMTIMGTLSTIQSVLTGMVIKLLSVVQFKRQPVEQEVPDHLLSHIQNGTGKSYNKCGRLEYAGDWKDGKRHGTGKSYYDSGELTYEIRAYCEKEAVVHYDGDWVDGKKHGSGKLYQDGKLRYDGGWLADKPHGYGKSYWNDELIYEGLYNIGDLEDGDICE